MNQKEFLANIVIGSIGAAGQSLLLAHSLNSYPFVILMSPPAQFYSRLGHVMGFVAPVLSIVVLYFFKSTRRPFITAIPAVACPLLFWLGYKLVFALSGYHYAAPAAVQSDVIATKSVEAGFTHLVLWLTVAGLFIGVLCGIAVWLLFRQLRHRAHA
ncbi:MAG TPA: hypothetical protein VN256_04255 [Pyrinomonadaceae bacterium]|nr:hypothetical protein [Pyrinomonadaceae bacterium]